VVVSAIENCDASLDLPASKEKEEERRKKKEEGEYTRK